jgi:ABC-2 type transport system permease protein
MNLTPLTTLTTLVRREFWEHRSLWIVPLAVAILIVVAAMFPHSGMQVSRIDYQTPEKYREYFGIFHGMLTIPQFVLLGVLLPYYLLDSLYAERKDRSILFWKSLPVSDAQTVLSKVLVALVIVPLGVYLLAIFTDIAASSILALRLRAVPMIGMFLRWDTQMWLRTQAFVLAALVVLIAWYAPVGAYLLVVSAWAKRSAFLWATVPPLVAMLLEWIAFDTHYTARFLDYRLSANRALSYPYHYVGPEPTVGGHPGMFDSIRPLAALANVDLWLGLVAAAALIYLAIRIRRYQSES